MWIHLKWLLIRLIMCSRLGNEISHFFVFCHRRQRCLFHSLKISPCIPVFPVSPCLILRMNVLRSVTYEVCIYNIYLDHGAILGCRLSFSSQKIERNLRSYKPILTLWHFSTVTTINVIYEQPYIQRSCVNIVTCQ